MTQTLRAKRFLGAIAVVAALVLVADTAAARTGRGGSFGSRGARTFQAPPPTTTAPRTTAPIERSIQQPGQPSATQRLGAGPTAQRPGFFNGFGGTMLKGLLIGGLIGLLLGHGFGGLAGLLGFLLQAGVVVLVVALLMRAFRRRQEPAYAGAGAPVHRDQNGTRTGGGALASLAGLGSRATGTVYDARPGAPKDEVGITQSDLDAFENALSEIQAAYGREDLPALRGQVTPEMLSYLSEEIAENAKRGVVNRVSGVKLLQGDLAESWREDGTDYATVAMRFALVDVTEDRATGQVVEGSNEPTEATEVWTFARARSGPARDRWLLSAIQQA